MGTAWVLIKKDEKERPTLETGVKWLDALRNPKGVMADNVYVEDTLKSGRLHNYERNFECCTGTALVYEAPDAPFRDVVRLNIQIGVRQDRRWWQGAVIYKKVEFAIPKDYQGACNIALVLKHPGINVEEQPNGTLLIKGPIVKAIENFPTSDGWYEIEGSTGIPHGKELLCYTSSARYLLRSYGKYGKNISPVGRIFDHDSVKPDIVAHWGPGIRCNLIWLNTKPDEAA
jgi:hypothetical protein